jgi:hypothetical protein
MVYGNILILQFIMDFIKSEPKSNSETYVASSYSDTKMTYKKEEKDPLLTVPVMQDENKVSLISLSVLLGPPYTYSFTFRSA